MSGVQLAEQIKWLNKNMDEEKQEHFSWAEPQTMVEILIRCSSRRRARIGWKEPVTVQPAVAVYFDFHVLSLTWLSHTLITVAFYNCLLQTVQWKGLPRAIVFFFQPSFTPPSVGNEALQPGLVSVRKADHCSAVCRTCSVLVTGISKSRLRWTLITVLIYLYCGLFCFKGKKPKWKQPTNNER